MKNALVLVGLGYALSCASPLNAGFRSTAVQATYRIGGPGSTATCFVVRRHSADGKQSARFLITAAHVLEKLQGETATLVARELQQETVTRREVPIPIRAGEQLLWIKHPTQDVAALRLSDDVPALETLPIETLATAEVWRTQQWEPGSTIWSIGCPHAGQFDPDPRGYALTRQGSMATFPVVPTAAEPTFLVEYNTFEGDSGGPILAADANNEANGWVIGLVHGQHMLNERYQLTYSEATMHQRLGMAIIVGSPLILETIALVPAA